MGLTTKNEQTKAQLVDRGFEERFLRQSDSPTVGIETMRTCLSFASINNRIFKITDIKYAFYRVKISEGWYIKPKRNMKLLTELSRSYAMDCTDSRKAKQF